MTRTDYEIVTAAGRAIATTDDVEVALALALLARHQATFDGAQLVEVVTETTRRVIAPNVVPLRRRRPAA